MSAQNPLTCKLHHSCRLQKTGELCGDLQDQTVFSQRNKCPFREVEFKVQVRTKEEVWKATHWS